MIEIPLTKGLVAIIDDEDAHLAAFKWYAAKIRHVYYAQRQEPTPGAPRRQRTICLHREVMRAPAGVKVDHANRDGLDCRRSNLRVASTSQNTQNSRLYNTNRSGFRGVQRNRRVGPGGRVWMAYITVFGKRLYLGSRHTAEEAARVYDDAARLYFGEFASLNFGATAASAAA